MPEFNKQTADENEKLQTKDAIFSGEDVFKRETPLPSHPYKVAVYIRYYNQTKYEDYLEYHKKQFLDTIALCPKWEFVDFYIDEGGVAPNMESAKDWCRLLADSENGKVNLIITQKVSNVSRKSMEVILCSRLLASLAKPVGIYFISENIFTLASRFTEEFQSTCFLNTSQMGLLEDTTEDVT